jgi:hypothetical protein
VLWPRADTPLFVLLSSTPLPQVSTEKECEVMSKQTRRMHKPTVNDRSREIPATMSPDQADIARLAYLHWLERGCPIGSPQEDWSRAEQDLKEEQTPVT